MAAPLGYQSFCPVGSALNVVGERWALLIVRDLFLGPRRYSELLKGLGGIGTDILAARLRTLQEQGIVRQVGSGRARRYELTDSGRALGPVLRELARWGADRVRLPADPSEVPARVPLTSLILGAAPYPRQATGVHEVRVEEEVVRVGVDADQVGAAADREPDTTIELTRAGLRALILGARASEIEKAGDVSIEGDRQRAHALLNTMTGPPLLAGLRPQLSRRESRR
ncbi:MAG TPA: winged helix-turn-helix transcriptional regulator [Gaiellaceae bacterium]|nr:winged helix-turn-helix transcriptional regulator [Gaiellaceae bacterium]